MTIRLRLEVANQIAEFEFNRTPLSVGRGPFNDIVIDAADVSTKVGEFHVAEGGVTFICGDDHQTRLLRDGEVIESADIICEWKLDVDDVIEFSPQSRLVMSAIGKKKGPPIQWLDLPNFERESDPCEVTIAMIASVLANDPTPGTVLRAACGLLKLHTDHEPLKMSLTRVREEDSYQRDALELVPHGEVSPANPAMRGEVRRVVDPFQKMGATGLAVLERLQRQPRAAVIRESDRRVIYVPLMRGVELLAVLGIELSHEGGEDLHEAALVAREIEPFAQLSFAHVDIRDENLSLSEENRHFRERERRHYLFKELICESDAMRKVYNSLNEHVDRDTAVLVAGEAGTGKELLARALHHLGERRDQMMVSVQCGKLEDSEIDVELFGCVKSEIAGALAARKGIFELAKEGTVFLEEIDLLSPLLQGKLVRMLNEGEVRRVGDTVGRAVTARLVCSVHRDLQELIAAGTIRRDLYLALKDVILPIPALRDRQADIMPLARSFLRKFAKRYERKCQRFHPDVQKRFLEYEWPGNVRELQTHVESAVLQCEDTEICMEHLAI